MSKSCHANFRLFSFERISVRELSLTGSLSLAKGSVRIVYELKQADTVNSSRVLWPRAKRSGERRDELWTTTCMEFFVTTAADQFYWEYNFSPCGDWNIYHLDDYRHGLKPEPCNRTPVIRGRSTPGYYQLEVTAELPSSLIQSPALKAGITAVVESHDRHISHWALYHGGSTADFHRRDGFTLHLENHSASQA
jgi:hypothetical protein